MKKLFFYAAVVLAAISFSVCSDDEEEEPALPATPENIAGTCLITHEAGWEIYDGEQDTWSENYPDEDGSFIFLSGKP